MARPLTIVWRSFPGGSALLAGALCGTLLLVAPTPARAQGRGVQLTPDGTLVLVNKDVGGDRFAITRHADGTVTGNVFRSDGTAPAFIHCEPLAAPDTFACAGADPCLDDGGRARGIQRTPDGTHVLVNKDVGGDRFAITLDADGTVTGNVFRSGGGSPAFIVCEPAGAPHAFTCAGADACTTDVCVDQYVPLGEVTLPGDFFAVPEPCGASFTFIDDVTLPSAFFTPPPDDGDTRCCLPDDSGPECEDRTPAACAALGGVDLGPGSCTPNPCSDGVPPPGAGVLMVRCERRAGRSKVSVDGHDLAAGSYRARISSGGHVATAPSRATIGDEVEFDFDSDGGDIAAGATAIAPTFLQGSPPMVTGAILTATGTTLLATTVVCDQR